MGNTEGVYIVQPRFSSTIRSKALAQEQVRVKIDVFHAKNNEDWITVGGGLMASDPANVAIHDGGETNLFTIPELWQKGNY